MEVADGLKMLAKLIAREHRDFLQAEREALRRSECDSVEFYEVEPEDFESLGQVCVVEGELREPYAEY